MGFFAKSLYLRTFFIILPLGIAITYASFKAITAPSGIDNMNYNKGIIEDFVIGKKFDIATEKDVEAYVISLKECNKKFYRFTRIQPDTIASYLSVGDSIEIWSDEESLFWQLKLNGKMLLKYKSGSILWFYGLLLFGICTIVIAVLHLIKGRRDLFGGNKKEENKDMSKQKKWTWF